MRYLQICLLRREEKTVKWRLIIMAADYEQKVIMDSSDFVVLAEYVPGIIQEIRYYSTYNFVGDRIPVRFAIDILLVCATELCAMLHAGDYRKRHLRLRLEVATSIVIPPVGRYEVVVVVVVIFNPFSVEIFAICQFTLYLHPSVGEWNVDKVKKSGSDLRDRSSIVALRQVAAAELHVEDASVVLLHADGQEDSTILDAAPQLLNPSVSRTFCVGIVAVGAEVVAAIICRFRPIADNIDAKSILEAFVGLQFAIKFATLHDGHRLSDYTAIVGHDVVRRKVACSEVDRSRSLPVERVFG